MSLRSLRSWVLPLFLAVPLIWVASAQDADSCIRFKKPGGSVPPGLRDPADPPPPPDEGETPATPGTPTTPSTTPSTPGAPVTAGAPPPTTGGPTSGNTGKPRKQAAPDASTWETWWELNRIDFFPKRWVQRAISPDESGLTPAGPQALSPFLVETKLWKMLQKNVNDSQVFVQEAALITMGRVAANEAQRQEARETLTAKLKHRNHLIARAAALGLFYVANEESILPMYEAAKDEKTEEDVRAFLALTMTNLEHPMAAQLLRDLADVKKGYYELVGAAIMGLGYTGIENDPWIPEFLEGIAFKKKNVRGEFRALAVESFGRLGDLTYHDIVLRGLTDRDTKVKRSAAIAIGVMDYRTDAEREIEQIKAPYEEFIGIPYSKEDEIRLETLEGQIKPQQKAMAKDVKKIVKAIAEAMQNDGDVFVRNMCLVSLGRIMAQNPHGALGMRYVDQVMKKDRIGTREYALIAMAIANHGKTLEHAKRFMEVRNPSTRGAACIAMGLIGDKDRSNPCSAAVRSEANQILLDTVRRDAHPFIKGYSALALGMIGNGKSAEAILTTIRKTGTPEARAYGVLGLALLGTKKGADDVVGILKSKQMRNGFVASHAVYALGLTKDRTALDTLVEKSLDRGDMYVQAATIAAVGYVSSSEFYPRRHLMATGYNYMLGLDYIETYFYKL